MKKRSLAAPVLVVVVALLATGQAIGWRGFSPLAAGTLSEVGTAFTYQGLLSEGSALANGTYDLRFVLYTADVGGSQVGEIVSREDVAVANGLFTVQLDFGRGVFSGPPRWLELGVRPGASTSAFTTLSPRQPLTPTPYAIHASTALTATTVPWAGLTGVPAGLVSLSGPAPTAGQVPKWNGSGWVAAADSDAAHYARTVVVSPVGTPTQNGNALLSALAAITGSATTPYLLRIEPGVYNVLTTPLTMKPYVDIEGSGELTTIITGTGAPAWGSGTVVGASNAELRFLAVNSVGGTNATAIFNSEASPRLTHVTAFAAGGSSGSYGVLNTQYSSPAMNNITAFAEAGGYGSVGVGNYAWSSPAMNNVTASASGASNNTGVVNDNASPTMSNVTASGSGGYENYGVRNNASSAVMNRVSTSASGGNKSYGVWNWIGSSPTMNNVTAVASGASTTYGVYNESAWPTMNDVTASASGGTDSYGVYNLYAFSTWSGQSGSMNNLTASASGATNNYGVYDDSSSPTIRNSRINAQGGSNSYGIYNQAAGGTYTATVTGSYVAGGTNSILTSSFFTAQVGASELDGGPVAGSGTYKCIGVYGANFQGLGGTCQ